MLMPIIHTSFAKSFYVWKDNLWLSLEGHGRRAIKPIYPVINQVQVILSNLTAVFQNVYILQEFVTSKEAFQACVKGNPFNYGMKIFELCEARIGYITNLEVCHNVHYTDQEHSGKICEPINISATLCTWTGCS
jgi:hypothetical protein